jgi:hypothetical protein
LLAVDFHGPLTFTDETLQRLALFVFDGECGAGVVDSLLQFDKALRMGVELELPVDEALLEILRFGFALGEACLDGTDLMGLALEAAAGALGVEIRFGKLLAGFSEQGLGLIGGLE